MAGIKRLKIDGYKSIKHLDLELSNLNVLIGANGSGKSNFISFFELVNAIKEYHPQLLNDYVAKKGYADNFLFGGSKVTKQIDAEVYNEALIYKFNLSWQVGNTFFYKDESFLNTKCISGYDNSTSEPDDVIIQYDNKEYIQLNSESLYLLKTYITCPTWHFNDTSPESLIRQKSNINDNEYFRSNGANLSSYLYLIKEKYPERYRHILDSLKIVAPFISRLNPRPDELNPNHILLEWVHRKFKDKYFDITHLSDGTLRFLCLATVLAMTGKDATIIIDEPELGLHPYALTILAGLIKSASVNSQIIVSTQSPELVSQFAPENIIVADLKEDATEFKRLNTGDLAQWLEDYSLGELWNQNILGGNP